MNLAQTPLALAVSTTSTTCPYCGVGCGVTASLKEDGRIGVQGDVQHPANFGRLCVKGSALAETVDLDGRLLHPQVRDAQGACSRYRGIRGWAR